MKNFNYINREHVNPIDLNILGRTYDTLEQGHQEAVKAASDLEVAMANLDLNEAESQWRQSKLNEIKQTVADNTNYGNAYGALDDIISKAGNIASDQGMIGRLQAQKDFKTYKDTLEKRTDLPEDYKEYYREANPYYYKDQIDDKTGNIIGSTKWKPIASPTQVVPLNELISQGLKWAAKESGGGEATRWIDVRGNVTNDPSQAYDGQVFNSTSSQWERLSKDKIMQGIKASIASTPGAKESIAQDYKIANWKHGKQVVANNGKPVISDVTDRNGIVLNEEQYLFKRIDPAVQSASYYNSVNKTSYGQGLATYKAGVKAATAAASAQQHTMEQGMIAGRDTPVNVPIDAAANFVAVKNVAGTQLKGLYKQITGKDLFIDDGNISNMEKLLNKNNIPTEARQQIRSLVKTYNEGVSNLESYTNKMIPTDKADFEFAARIKSGGELKSSANGGSKYDDRIIQDINKLYGNGETVEISLSDDNIRKEFENIIGGGQYNGYKNLGISINNNKITIPKSAMYSTPLIFDALDKAKKSAKNIVNEKGSFVDKYFKPDSQYTIDVLDKNAGSIDSDVSWFNINPKELTKTVRGTRNVANIVGNFRKADEIGKDIANKYKIANTSVQLSSLNLDGNHFTDGTLFDQYNKGILSKEQYDIQKKYYDQSFDNILSNTDFSQMDMYSLAEGDNVKRRVVDGAERFNFGSDILKAVKDKRVTVTPSIVPGINDPISGAPIAGYNITVLPEKKDGKESKDAPKRFYIPGLVNETASKYMMQDPTVQSFNAITIAGATKSTKSLTDTNVNPRLGNISVTGLGSNNYMVDFNGIRKSVNQDVAVKLTTALNNYNAVKNRFMAESYGKEGYKLNDAMKSTIANAATTIGSITGTNPNAVLEKLIDDINK